MTENTDQETPKQKAAKFVGLGCLGSILLVVLAIAATCTSADQDAARDRAILTTLASQSESDAFKADVVRLTNIIQSCEGAVEGIQEVASRSDPYAAYEAAKAASDTCSAASEQIAVFEFDAAISSARRDQLAAIKNRCAGYLTVRGGSMDEIAKVFNGDTSPAQVSKAKDVADAAATQSTACAVATVDAAQKAGFDALATDLNKPERGTASAEAPAEADNQSALLQACVDADGTIGNDFIAAIKSGHSNGNFREGEFRAHLQAMVDACRPILPAFITNSGNIKKDLVARHCQNGYRLKIEAYQDMLDGVADAKSATTLIESGNEMQACNTGIAAMQGE